MDDLELCDVCPFTDECRIILWKINQETREPYLLYCQPEHKNHNLWRKYLGKRAQNNPNPKVRRRTKKVLEPA